MSFWHIYPTNDLEEHDTESSQCKCNPKLEEIEDTGDFLIVHNSFDGREAVEMAKEIING